MGYNFNLKNARKKAGYTQKQVADMLGISQNNYSYWEQGKVTINSSYLEKLSKIFNCTVEELLNIGAEEKRSIEKCVDFAFDMELDMVEFIQSGVNRCEYYASLDDNERKLFVYLLLLTENELAVHKLALQETKDKINKIAWFIDGKVPYANFMKGSNSKDDEQ